MDVFTFSWISTQEPKFITLLGIPLLGLLYGVYRKFYRSPGKISAVNKSGVQQTAGHDINTTNTTTIEPSKARDTDSKWLEITDALHELIVKVEILYQGYDPIMDVLTESEIQEEYRDRWVLFVECYTKADKVISTRRAFFNDEINRCLDDILKKCKASGSDFHLRIIRDLKSGDPRVDSVFYKDRGHLPSVLKRAWEELNSTAREFLDKT